MPNEQNTLRDVSPYQCCDCQNLVRIDPHECGKTELVRVDRMLVLLVQVWTTFGVHAVVGDCEFDGWNVVFANTEHVVFVSRWSWMDHQ